MSMRRPRINIDINKYLTITLLDNDDVIVDDYGPIPMNLDTVIESVYERIASITRLLQQLHLVKDVLIASREEDMANVKRVYNSDGDALRFVDVGPCADCDEPNDLIASQWGYHKSGDLVCTQCEEIREHEYGIPPHD
jgi:hypothetical protein